MRELDTAEALRYLGAGEKATEELRRQVFQTSRTLVSSVQPRWTWKAFDLVREASRDRQKPLLSLRLHGNDIPAMSLYGHTAEVMLASCQKVVMLVCTLGPAFDAMLRAAQKRDMGAAVVLDACGSAWVEAGCSEAETEIAVRFPGLYLTDRYSPGYGDLSLSLQRDICALLDTPRRLGVHVTDSLMLNPSKSVTALVGISDCPQMARIRGCAFCSMRKDCPFRKCGKSCAI